MSNITGYETKETNIKVSVDDVREIEGVVTVEFATEYDNGFADLFAQAAVWLSNNDGVLVGINIQSVYEDNLLLLYLFVDDLKR